MFIKTRNRIINYDLVNFIKKDDEMGNYLHFYFHNNYFETVVIKDTKSLNMAFYEIQRCILFSNPHVDVSDYEKLESGEL